MAFLIPTTINLISAFVSLPCPCCTGLQQDKPLRYKSVALATLKFGAINAGHLKALSLLGYSISPIALGFAGTAIVTGLFMSIYFNHKKPGLILQQVVSAVALAALSCLFTHSFYNFVNLMKLRHPVARTMAEKMQTKTNWWARQVEFNKNYNISLKALASPAEQNSVMFMVASFIGTIAEGCITGKSVAFL